MSSEYELRMAVNGHPGKYKIGYGSLRGYIEYVQRQLMKLKENDFIDINQIDISIHRKNKKEED
jgi:hypothetical protein